jgi:hypothetical protein
MGGEGGRCALSAGLRGTRRGRRGEAQHLTAAAEGRRGLLRQRISTSRFCFGALGVSSERTMRAPRPSATSRGQQMQTITTGTDQTTRAHTHRRSRPLQCAPPRTTHAKHTPQIPPQCRPTTSPRSRARHDERVGSNHNNNFPSLFKHIINTARSAAAA